MAKLTDVAGIGPVTANVLTKHHIKTPEALAEINITDLEKIPGFSQLRAKAVKKAAKDCLSNNKNKKPSTQPTGKTTSQRVTDASKQAVSVNTATQKEKHGINKNTIKEKPKNKKKEKEKIN